MQTRLTVRPACEADLDDIENMINDFVRGHPAEKQTRSRSALREAYFADVVVFKNSISLISLKRWLRIVWFSDDRIRG